MNKIIEKKNKKEDFFNWFLITKIFWKENLLFYLITTFSALFNYFIDENVGNATRNISKYIFSKNNKSNYNKFYENAEILDLKIFGNVIYSFKIINFFLFLIPLMILYSILVFLHVYFSCYLMNKISLFLKKKIINKFFLLKKYNKERIISNINEDEKIFTRIVVFFPNQLYYLIITNILFFYKLFKSDSNIIIRLVFIGIFSILFVCYYLNYLLYKKDLLFKKKLEPINKLENIFINNRNLIIKNNSLEDYKDKYDEEIKNFFYFSDLKNFYYSLALVFPSYFLIPIIENFILPIICILNFKEYPFNIKTINSKTKKAIDRLKEYPYYISSKNRLNSLFNDEIRDEINENKLIEEKIEKISLEKVSFGYNEKVLILKEIDLTFEVGDINYLSSKNGTGKSTIVDLILGILIPENGKIMINNNNDLKDLNLQKWRKQISFCSHENLIEEGSTGQRQLKNINKSLAKESQVIILDEADNGLDESNKKELITKLTNISKKKIVIYISH